MTDLEREWSEVPTDLAGWAMRATKVLRQRDTLLAALREIRDELGVPNEDYAAPVANAVDIATAAIAEVEGDLVDRMSTDKGPVFYDADQEHWVEGKP